MSGNVILIVLDSLGVGALPDAESYGDAGADTLGNIYRERGLDIPGLCDLGIGKITPVGCPKAPAEGCWGRMRELSPGKDTTTGHWEMTGVVLDFTFPTYPDGFPDDIIREFEKKIGTGTLGNYARSGTEILEDLGDKHCSTGYPIVYTSADSVFQIAAHEDVVPLEKLYEYSLAAREILGGPNPVARVIARPFNGVSGDYRRNNAGRRDYSIEPPSPTLLDNLKEEGKPVCGVGKIGDIFAHRGLTEEIKTKDNFDTVDRTVEAVKRYRGRGGLIMANLVEFDSVYGHRRDAEGYGRALEEFDRRIPEIKSALSEEDILIVTADHGCDPAHSSHTDHTREYVPLLIFGAGVKADFELGMELEFSDCGQTVADLLGSRKLDNGRSLKDRILRKGV